MTIISAEVERLARLVGAQTGRTPEQVIREAVEAQARIAGVEVPDSLRAKDVDLARVREITRRVASRPLLDERSPREIADEAWSRRE
jgi:antitoxin VapB